MESREYNALWHDVWKQLMAGKVLVNMALKRGERVGDGDDLPGVVARLEVEACALLDLIGKCHERLLRWYTERYRTNLVPHLAGNLSRVSELLAGAARVVSKVEKLLYLTCNEPVRERIRQQALRLMGATFPQHDDSLKNAALASLQALLEAAICREVLTNPIVDTWAEQRDDKTINRVFRRTEHNEATMIGFGRVVNAMSELSTIVTNLETVFKKVSQSASFSSSFTAHLLSVSLAFSVISRSCRLGDWNDFLLAAGPNTYLPLPEPLNSGALDLAHRLVRLMEKTTGMKDRRQILKECVLIARGFPEFITETNGIILADMVDVANSYFQSARKRGDIEEGQSSTEPPEYDLLDGISIFVPLLSRKEFEDFVMPRIAFPPPSMSSSSKVPRTYVHVAQVVINAVEVEIRKLAKAKDMRTPVPTGRALTKYEIPLVTMDQKGLTQMIPFLYGSRAISKSIPSVCIMVGRLCTRLESFSELLMQMGFMTTLLRLITEISLACPKFLARPMVYAVSTVVMGITRHDESLAGQFFESTAACAVQKWILIALKMARESAKDEHFSWPYSTVYDALGELLVGQKDLTTIPDLQQFLLTEAWGNETHAVLRLLARTVQKDPSTYPRVSSALKQKFAEKDPEWLKAKRALFRPGFACIVELISARSEYGVYSPNDRYVDSRTGGGMNLFDEKLSTFVYPSRVAALAEALAVFTGLAAKHGDFDGTFELPGSEHNLLELFIEQLCRSFGLHAFDGRFYFFYIAEYAWTLEPGAMLWPGCTIAVALLGDMFYQVTKLLGNYFPVAHQAKERPIPLPFAFGSTNVVCELLYVFRIFLHDPCIYQRLDLLEMMLFALANMMATDDFRFAIREQDCSAVLNILVYLQNHEVDFLTVTDSLTIWKIHLMGLRWAANTGRGDPDSKKLLNRLGAGHYMVRIVVALKKTDRLVQAELGKELFQASINAIHTFTCTSSENTRVMLKYDRALGKSLNVLRERYPIEGDLLFAFEYIGSWLPSLKKRTASKTEEEEEGVAMDVE